MKQVVLFLALLIFISCNSRNRTVKDNGEFDTARRIIEIKNAMILKKGCDGIVEHRYNGIMPAAETEGIYYDLTLWSPAFSESGIFELDMTLLNIENGKDIIYRLYGKWHVYRTRENENEMTVYHLIPENSNKDFSTDFNVDFIYKTDSLIVFNRPVEWLASSEHKNDYILKLVQ